MGWEISVRLEVGGARRSAGGSISRRFSVLGAERRGPLSFSGGSGGPSSPGWNAALAPQNGPAEVSQRRVSSFLYICAPHSGACVTGWEVRPQARVAHAFSGSVSKADVPAGLAGNGASVMPLT